VPIDATKTNQQISDSIGAMLLLNSSCQALIEVSIAPSASPWYPILDQELGAAEDLVVDWRQNGYRYFQDEILGQIAGCGKGFLASQSAVDGMFQTLEAKFDPTVLNEIVTRLAGLEAPVRGMIDALDGYTAKLATFEQAMGVPYAQMNHSVAQIQAQEADLQQQIATISSQIAALQQQVQADRDAIAKAEAQRTTGIIETIFGVLLTPVTGGASLILTGIGVGTIAEAQEKVSSLETTISQYQTAIVGDQQDLSGDEQQVATLSGLSMSMALALNDVAAIDTALDALRTTWGVLLGELQNAAGDLAKAQSAQQAIVAQVWFDATCNVWQAIVPFVDQINGYDQPMPKIVPIGQ
jgi:DNA-binding transcriptional MerR regulator